MSLTLPTTFLSPLRFSRAGPSYQYEGITLKAEGHMDCYANVCNLREAAQAINAYKFGIKRNGKYRHRSFQASERVQVNESRVLTHTTHNRDLQVHPKRITPPDLHLASTLALLSGSPSRICLPASGKLEVQKCHSQTRTFEDPIC